MADMALALHLNYRIMENSLTRWNYRRDNFSQWEGLWRCLVVGLFNGRPNEVMKISMSQLKKLENIEIFTLFPDELV